MKLSLCPRKKVTQPFHTSLQFPLLGGKICLLLQVIISVVYKSVLLKSATTGDACMSYQSLFSSSILKLMCTWTQQIRPPYLGFGHPHGRPTELTSDFGLAQPQLQWSEWQWNSRQRPLIVSSFVTTPSKSINSYQKDVCIAKCTDSSNATTKLYCTLHLPF